MPGVPSWLRRLASFLARLFRGGPASSPHQPTHPTSEEKRDVALARGDFDEAARLVIETMGPPVLRYLRALPYDSQNAEIVFRVFAEDLRKELPAWRRQVSLRSWVYRLAWKAARRLEADPLWHGREAIEDAGASRPPAVVAAATGASEERRVAALRAVLTPEEQSLLVLRLDRQLSWQEVAEVMAEDGRPPRERHLRDRFGRLKGRLSRIAKEKGLDPAAAWADGEPFGRLAVAEVARLVGDSRARLFDVRSPEAYAQGHLPGAARVAPGDVVRNLPADGTLHLVYYGEDTRDLSCHGAARAAAQAGYLNVSIMPAGIGAWKEAGKRVETEG